MSDVTSNVDLFQRVFISWISSLIEMTHLSFAQSVRESSSNRMELILTEITNLIKWICRRIQFNFRAASKDFLQNILTAKQRANPTYALPRP